MKHPHPIVLVLAVLAFVPSVVQAADAQRQQEIAKRGAQVMPFDLAQTTHLFQPLEDGGLQRVTANDPKNQTQIGLIQAHLKDEAGRFSRGDFSSPAAIHGARMPGVAELSRGVAHINMHYAELPDGAEIRYSTKDPALVRAIHRWFQAQLHDHGRHATPHPRRRH